MPRVGVKRKKRRTEEDVEISEAEKKKTPRCFVLKRGNVGDRIKDLVQDFRTVMLPNCAKSLRESKANRIEDFMAVAGNFGVSHLVLFTATKMGTYMKLIKLPQGPTMTFKIASFSLARDVLGSQKRPRIGSRDYTVAPLQVLNGFGGANKSGDQNRELTAEMLRGMFPAVDVPTFKQTNCRRTALFHRDPETDSIHFRHFSVARKQAGLNRGVSKLLHASRLPKLGRTMDIADLLLGGGDGAESEAEDPAQEVVPAPAGDHREQVAVRLSEVGPRLELLLVKTEEGVCNGTVLYHRFQTRTPSQQEVLEAKARQRKKLQARNKKLDEQTKGVKAKKKEFEKKKDEARKKMAAPAEDDASSDGGGNAKGGKGGGGQGAGDVGKKKRFHPFGWGSKSKKPGEDGTVEFGDKREGDIASIKDLRGADRRAAYSSKGKGGGKDGGGKGKGKKGGKSSKGKGKGSRESPLDRFKKSAKRG